MTFEKLSQLVTFAERFPFKVGKSHPEGRILLARETQITSLLQATRDGDAAAADRLWRAVYDELRRIAKARMAAEGRNGDLQTTVLVHEAYVRLMRRVPEREAGKTSELVSVTEPFASLPNESNCTFPANRAHFFAAAAKAMRQFLVDDARRRGAQKRGGGRSPAPLDEPVATLDHDPAQTLAVDEALRKLAERDPRKAEVVQLRYFAGLTIDETAEIVGISSRMVDKEWRFAKAWLHRALE